MALTVSYTYTNAQAAVLAKAYGEALGLGRDATVADLKAYHNNIDRQIAASYERQQAAAQASVTDMTAA